MNPQRLEVWLARAALGDSTDMRPVIVLGASEAGTVNVLLVSAALDLRTDADFPLEPDHLNFPATGLGRPSYVLADRVRQLPVSALVRRRGCLQGALAHAFEEWLG